MSWLGVNHNPHKSGMHCLLQLEILKKKGQEEGLGSCSDPPEKKQKVQMSMDSEEEEDVEPMERKKRTLPMFRQLQDQFVLSGKDVNDILAATFIGDVSTKKP
jgi:hypothetical protein